MSKNRTHHPKNTRSKFAKKALYSLSLALAMLTTSAFAKLDVRAFKDVSSHFVVTTTNEETKETTITADNTMYSPTFGMVALESGLVENIRLYGDYTPAFYKNGEDSRYAEGSRKYVGDESKDPIWNVVNILFPSNAGVLSTDTTHQANFGKAVSDPKTVACPSSDRCENF
jgi:hypothetical protein